MKISIVLLVYNFILRYYLKYIEVQWKTGAFAYSTVIVTINLYMLPYNKIKLILYHMSSIELRQENPINYSYFPADA